MEEHQRDWSIYVQLLTYACNAQGHRATNLLHFRLVLSRQPTGFTTLDSSIAVPTEFTATRSPHILRAPLLHCVATMRQDAEKRVNTKQRHYNNDEGQRICKATLMLNAWQYVFMDCPPMTACATERLETDSYSTFMYITAGQFRVVKVWWSKITFDEDDISSTVSFDCVRLGPTRATTQDVMNDANNVNKAGLPTGAMQRNVHRQHVMDNFVNSKNRHSNECNDDNDNDEVAKEQRARTRDSKICFWLQCARYWQMQKRQIRWALVWLYNHEQ